ncbi:MAG: hydrogenase [Lachnospiraceae bacterium]|nr:hydrogenase [Lachnospiraceae bacterium]
MSYKIAVASSDGKQIDESFGSAESFLIYEVADGTYRILEKRIFQQESGKGKELPAEEYAASGSCGAERNCNHPIDCGNGTEGGCGGAGGSSAKVEVVSDCRCVVCRKIGFHIQKQLERKAISAFDVSVPVDEALAKIAYYFERMDNHVSLRGQNSR